MTYFQLFELPVSLLVDKATLPKKYFELSRRYHPDFFINAAEAEKAEALEKSALLNKALKTFQHPDETIKYVLQLKGLLQEEEKYELPPAFLMEVLEINEGLMEDDSNPALATRLQELQSEIYAPVQETIENYKDGSTTEKELLQVKAYYYQKKYLDRIQQQLSGMS